MTSDGFSFAGSRIPRAAFCREVTKSARVNTNKKTVGVTGHRSLLFDDEETLSHLFITALMPCVVCAPFPPTHTHTLCLFRVHACLSVSLKLRGVERRGHTEPPTEPIHQTLVTSERRSAQLSSAPCRLCSRPFLRKKCAMIRWKTITKQTLTAGSLIAARLEFSLQLESLTTFPSLKSVCVGEKKPDIFVVKCRATLRSLCSTEANSQSGKFNELTIDF